MEQEDALAGDYVAVMLAAILLWVAFVAAGVAMGGYLAVAHL